jgi:hypothetical protein
MSNRYHCGCGSYIQRNGIKRHKQTKKHLTWIHSHKNCGVCYEVQEHFIYCEKCEKGLCKNCLNRLTRLRCPYCRSPYNYTVVHDIIEPYGLQGTLIQFYNQMSRLDEMRQQYRGTEPSRFVAYLRNYLLRYHS